MQLYLTKQEKLSLLIMTLKNLKAKICQFYKNQHFENYPKLRKIMFLF